MWPLWNYKTEVELLTSVVIFREKHPFIRPIFLIVRRAYTCVSVIKYCHCWHWHIKSKQEEYWQIQWGANIYDIEVTQSCLTLCHPMDCGLPDSSVHGIFQARVLEWVAISFCRGFFRPRDWTQVSCIADRPFTIWVTREAPKVKVSLYQYSWEVR